MMRIVISLIVGAVAAWGVTRDLDWGLAISWLGATDLWLAAVGIVIGGLGVIVRAVRWKLFFPPNATVPGVWPLAAAVVVGQAVNNVVPFRAGELVRAYALRGRAGVPLSVGIGTQLGEKAVELAAVLALLPFALAWGPASIDFRWASVAAAAILALAALALVLTPAAVTSALLDSTARRAPRPGRNLIPRIRPLLEAARGGLITERLPKLTFWTLIGWALATATNWLLLQALAIQVPPVASLFLLLVLTVGMFAPAPPGRIGVHEYLVVSSLGLYGVSTELALAYALALRLVVFVPTTVAGALILVLPFGMESSGRVLSLGLDSSTKRP